MPRAPRGPRPIAHIPARAHANPAASSKASNPLRMLQSSKSPNARVGRGRKCCYGWSRVKRVEQYHDHVARYREIANRPVQVTANRGSPRRVFCFQIKSIRQSKNEELTIRKTNIEDWRLELNETQFWLIMSIFIIFLKLSCCF